MVPEQYTPQDIPPSSSGDILPASFFARDVIKQTLQSADLTIIYNRHGDAPDAERSTELIQPGSAVFIEGFSTTPGINSELHDVVDSFSWALCQYGPESDEYTKTKQLSLTYLEQLAMTPADSWVDFHVHKCREVSLLIQKNCYVAFADYNQNGSTVEDTAKREQRNTAFAQDYEASKKFPFLDYGDTNHNLAKTIVSLEKNMLHEYRMHSIRETFAAHAYLRNLNMIKDIDNQNVLRRNSNGKLQTYMIFGTAHARSLTTNLERWGASPDTVELMQLEEYKYIPKDAQAYSETLRQKLALKAFDLLARSLGAEGEGITEASKQLYAALKPLETNQTGGDDTIRILCELLETNKLSYLDPSKAGKRLEDTYIRIIEGNL